MGQDIWGPEDGLHVDTNAWNLQYGDPSGQAGGYFIGGAGEKGARWSTSDGDFTGSIHEGGLDSHIGDVHATADFKKKEGDVAVGDAFDLFGGGSGLHDYKAGIKTDLGVGPLTLDPSLFHTESGGQGSETAELDWKEGGTAGSLSATHADAGGWSFGTSTSADGVTFRETASEGGQKVGLDLTQALGGGDSYSLGFNQQGTTTGFSLGATEALGGGGSLSEHLSGNYGDSGWSGLDAGVKYAGGDSNAAFDIKQTAGGGTGIDVSGGLKSGGLSLGGSLDANVGGAAGDSISGRLNESFGSSGFGEKLSIGGSSSEKGESLDASGSAELKVAPDLYAGAFGSYSSDSAKGNDWFAGGSLTYMASPTIGLTAAGGYGSNGAEGRIQADFYKGSVHGADDLEDKQSHPMFNIFADVSSGQPGQLDPFMGGSKWDAQTGGGGGPTFTAGVGFNF
jgi:hypothetical protein